MKITKVIYSLDEIKNKCKTVFDNYASIVNAYLFGSYSRGEETFESDLDFMIELNDYSTSTKRKAYEAMVDLEDVFNKPIDFITKENAFATMSNSIKRDSIKIYEKR